MELRPATVNAHSRAVVTQLAMNFTDRLGRGTVLIAALLFLAAPAAAQGFKWWQSDLYKRELGLTPEQSRRLEERVSDRSADPQGSEEGAGSG